MAMDRVALVAWFWFAFWTGLGVALGMLLETPGTGALLGFFFSLFGTFTWPWIMPEADQCLDGPRRARTIGAVPPNPRLDLQHGRPVDLVLRQHPRLLQRRRPPFAPRPAAP